MTDPTEDLIPEALPMTAQAVLVSLIKKVKADRAVTQEAIDHHTQEAARLDAIREGMEAALQAVRYPRAAGRPSPDMPAGTRHSDYGRDTQRG